MPISPTLAPASVAVLALLALASCRADGPVWSRYDGSVTSNAAPASPAAARLTVSSDGDTAFSGYLEIDKPLAHTAGGVWGWYPPDSVAFLTLSALEDTILWTAVLSTDTTKRLDGHFEIVGGRRAGEGGTWTATLTRGSALDPRDSAVAIAHGSGASVPWLVLGLGFLALSIAIGWALQPSPFTRVDPATLGPTDAEINGVGGWMVWFLFGQAVTIIWTLVQLPTTYAPFHDGTWEMGQVFPAFQPILTLELLMASIQIAAPALGMILTFRHDPRAPRLWFIYLASVMVYSIVEVVAWPQLQADLADSFGQATADEASKEVAGDMRRTARSIVWAPIWMTYWSISRRVRITFGRGALGALPEHSTTSLVPRRPAAITQPSTTRPSSNADPQAGEPPL